ncbi:hypothetical protein [Pararhizobium polonicum]|uniref:hypothetical protein n=1 Tax=Pararhizobium polonicum TaxID=1612624 RepID=UPI000BFF67EE|nr:hypothetical protein [Pararhizobium polonicum]
MSNTTEYSGNPQDTAIALFLQDENADKLTDILVDALDDAFRILSEELATRSLN